MSKTLARATLALSTTWVQVTAVHAVVIPSDECKFAYGDTQPASTIDGSIVYNQDSIENPADSKLWLKPTVEAITYVVHEF